MLSDKMLGFVSSFGEFLLMVALQDKTAAVVMVGLLVFGVILAVFGMMKFASQVKLFWRKHSPAEWVNPFRSPIGRRKTVRITRTSIPTEE